MEATSDDALQGVNAAVAETLDRNDLVNAAEERKSKAENRGERKRKSKRSPEDDSCPFCLGPCTIPCQGNCEHWYCGGCIFRWWNYAGESRPCQCPTCRQIITKLSPEASLQQRQEQEPEVKEVLAKIRRYNRLFVGGLTGFVQRMVWHMMDLDANNLYLHEVRIFAMFMSTLYTAAEFNFIPTGGYRIVTVFDNAAIAMILILRLVGIYRRRRSAD